MADEPKIDRLDRIEAYARHIVDRMRDLDPSHGYPKDMITALFCAAAGQFKEHPEARKSFVELAELVFDYVVHEKGSECLN